MRLDLESYERTERSLYAGSFALPQFETIEYPDYGLHFNIEDSPDSIIHKILEPEK